MNWIELPDDWSDPKLPSCLLLFWASTDGRDGARCVYCRYHSGRPLREHYISRVTRHRLSGAKLLVFVDEAGLYVCRHWGAPTASTEDGNAA